MTVYQPPELTIDRATIYAELVDDVEAAIPGLRIVEGTLAWALVSAIATRHADELELLVARAEGEYRAFGEKIVGVVPRDATPATGTITIEAVDTDGYTIDAGTELTLQGLDGNRAAFYVRDTTAIAPGDDTAAGVAITAVVAGAAGTGLSADAQLEQALAWVAAITVDAPTVGGAEGETEDEFLDRLTDRMRLLTDSLVTPVDFTLAAEQQPGIGRALALDLYDADTDTEDVGGHMTVVVVAADGTPVSLDAKTAVAAALTAQAVSGLEVHVIDATYTTITVAFTGVAYPTAVASDVEARAEKAVLDFLHPGRWGASRSGEIGDNAWRDEPKVRFQDVSAVLNGVEGFNYWTALTINGGTADVTLAGPAGLPAAAPTSTVAGTVT